MNKDRINDVIDIGLYGFLGLCVFNLLNYVDPTEYAIIYKNIVLVALTGAFILMKIKIIFKEKNKK